VGGPWGRIPMKFAMTRFGREFAFGFSISWGAPWILALDLGPWRIALWRKPRG
jgi:hypothetical protein